MRRTRRVFTALVLAAATLTAGGQAFAQEESQSEVSEFAFDSYVVTASRIPEKLSKVAANVTVIANEAIEKGAFSQVSDILRAHNVHIPANGSVYSYPVINGDDRVLVLVNGRRMNWSHLVVSGNSRAFNMNNLAVKNIERIEIVRGPNSALYGSDAVGGVINIITKKSVEEKTTLAQDFGTWNDRRTTLTQQGGSDSLRYMFTIEKHKRDNYQFRNAISGNKDEFSDSYIDREYANLRVDKLYGSDKELSFEIEGMSENNGYGLYIKNPVSEGKVNQPGAERDGSDFNTSITYSWNKDRGKADFFRIYRNHSDAQTIYGTNPYKHKLYAVGAEYQQSWLVADTYTLISGLDVRREKFDQLSSGIQSGAHVSTSALFLENRLDLGNRWSLNLGARYDHHSDFGNDTTAHISLNKELSDVTNMYLAWGQSIKNPSMTMRYSNTENMIGNPDLVPESGDTWTLGLNSNLDKKTYLQTSLYISEMKNALAWQSGSPGKYINLNREKRRGLELSITRNMTADFKVSAGYSYAKVEKQNASDGYYLDYLNSRPNGYWLSTQYDNGRFDAGATLLAGTGRDESTYSNSSYVTLDLTAGYKLSGQTRIYAKGMNLTDEAYEMINTGKYPGRYPMLGRHFLMGIEHTF
ncbi:TonB-dependent receptor plug domain-containing protein [Sporomusa termitida]|uniref:Vitamin B12 transporter BtuB n=1 Tax=Sporomusa termitida TaxID=2377 RepID=A0A517DV84_9FIRM|nr:TonB-dependent receptor [Sporomusa termitida]QDR81248.1 Vitamin B12 transporter BtuB [Sporomusa termitida]